jgi:hypothetical protein
MKVLIFSLLSLCVYPTMAFDKIIDSTEGYQEVIMRGNHGHSGMNAHCSMDDESESGSNGGDGEDAGRVLILYKTLADIKNVKVISRPGRGGDGGDGCNGGLDGSDGRDGEHAVVYLYSKKHGAFTYSETEKTITPQFDRGELNFSKNVYGENTGVKTLLAAGSNSQSKFFTFYKKIFKTLRVENNILEDFETVKISYDFKEEKIKTTTAKKIVVTSSSENQVVLDKLINKSALVPDRFKVRNFQGQKYLVIEDLTGKYNIKANHHIRLMGMEKHWAFGYVEVSGYNVEEKDILKVKSELYIPLDLGKLNLNRSFFKKRFIGIRNNLELPTDKLYYSERTNISIRR